MRSIPRSLRWAVPLVGVALAVAACSSSASSTPPSGGSAATSSASAASASGTPVKGGTMQVAFQSDPDTFDPQVCYDATCWDNMQMLFDRLYDYKGATTDLEAAAIEAGANDFEPLSSAQNDDIPEGHAGARFVTERTAVHAVSTWLKVHGWSVVTSELGHLAKTFPELDEMARGEVGEFLQALEDHDDVQRVWAAVK